MTPRQIYATIAAVLLIASVPAALFRYLYEYRYYATEALTERLRVEEAGGDRRALEEMFRRLEAGRLDPQEKEFLFARLVRLDPKVRSIYAASRPIAVELAAEAVLPLGYALELRPVAVVSGVVLPPATVPYVLRSPARGRLLGPPDPGVARDVRLVANAQAPIEPGKHRLRVDVAMAISRSSPLPGQDATEVFTRRVPLEVEVRVVLRLPAGYPPIIDVSKTNAASAVAVQALAAPHDASGIRYPSLRIALLEPLPHGIAHALEVSDEGGRVVYGTDWRVRAGELADAAIALDGTRLSPGRHLLRVRLTPSAEVALRDNAQIETVWGHTIDERVEVEVLGP